MLAKLTAKNQLTLPKAVTEALGPVQYFEVQEKAGQIILTPVRIQRGDALRAKLAELDIGEAALERALDWTAGKLMPAKKASKARKTATAKAKPATPASKPAARRPTAAR